MSARELLQYEIDVLRMMDGGPEIPWGAAMSVALEVLEAKGYCTAGPHYQITDAGRAALHEQGGE